MRAVMSLYKRAKVEFEVELGVTQGTVLSPLFFGIMVDVVTESLRDGLLTQILHADDLVLMNERLEGEALDIERSV